MRIFRIVYITISLFILSYLTIPNIGFPDPPSDAYQSLEPADTETTLRRAYFTNLTRDQIVDHYRSQFVIKILGREFPNYKLNYPPEEAYGLIRDQTRSTYLEEIVYPMRESVFINGFEPQSEKDAIFINGVNYLQKITIKYYPSSVVERIFIGIAVLCIGYVVTKTMGREIMSFYKSFQSKPK